MPSRVAQSGLWTVSTAVGAADLNKDPGGWVEANTIGLLDTAGPGSGRLIDGSFAARSGRSYLIHVSLAGVYFFAGSPASFASLLLYVNGVLVRSVGMRQSVLGDGYFGPVLSHKFDSAGTGTITVILDQVVSAAATLRHDGGTHPGMWLVQDIGPTS